MSNASANNAAETDFNRELQQQIFNCLDNINELPMFKHIDADIDVFADYECFVADLHTILCVCDLNTTNIHFNARNELKRLIKQIKELSIDQSTMDRLVAPLQLIYKNFDDDLFTWNYFEIITAIANHLDDVNYVNFEQFMMQQHFKFMFRPVYDHLHTLMLYGKLNYRLNDLIDDNDEYQQQVYTFIEQTFGFRPDVPLCPFVNDYQTIVDMPQCPFDPINNYRQHLEPLMNDYNQQTLSSILDDLKEIEFMDVHYGNLYKVVNNKIKASIDATVVVDNSSFPQNIMITPFKPLYIKSFPQYYYNIFIDLNETFAKDVIDIILTDGYYVHKFDNDQQKQQFINDWIHHSTTFILTHMAEHVVCPEMDEPASDEEDLID